MRLIRIAIANVNTTVGAVRSNVDRALRIAREAAADGATIVALPEQLIAGYSPEALVQGGKVLGIVPKEKLPTYNVFYEARVFARGRPGLIDEVHGVPFGDLIF